MTTTDNDRTATGRPPRSADLRFQQLAALADEGNEDATGDLFREYGVPGSGGSPTGGFGLSGREAVAT
jgi:hypothetical protein